MALMTGSLAQFDSHMNGGEALLGDHGIIQNRYTGRRMNKLF